jgi:hypothetical protein
MKDAGAGRQALPASPLDEVASHLAQIASKHPDTRLTVDLANDALHDVTRQMKHLAGKAQRSRRRHRALRHLTNDLLDALAQVPTPPWGDGSPGEEGLAVYQPLRARVLPSLASALHAETGRGEVRDYLLLLSEQVLRRGQRALVAGYVRGAGPGRAALCERVCPLVMGHLGKALARLTGSRLSAAARQSAEAAIRQALAALDVLLHSSPSVRLFWPSQGEPVDAARHERGSGKGQAEDRVVLATLLPGLWAPAEGRVLEKALVATRRASESPALLREPR